MPAKWTTLDLTNNPLGPGNFRPHMMLLMTDGSVLIQDGGGKLWLRYYPSTDPSRAYTAGRWDHSQLTMQTGRSDYASGVLRDGRVFVIGGEHFDMGNDTPLGEIFDPVANSWSPLEKPAAFDFIQGDAPSCILADGRVLLGGPNPTSPPTIAEAAIWDPAATTNAWSLAGTRFGTTADTMDGQCSECTWALLPDGSVMAVEILTGANGPNSAQ
jgi:hypothetical protein